MNLGITIKNFRQQKGIKQNVLAEKSGITQTYLSQIENNIKEPNISTLRIICTYLEIPLPVLFFLSFDENDVKPEKRSAFKHIEPSIKSMISEFFT
ncbi:MAG: helix-turn-helix transcriptional regulator [Bacteroidetes bacterium]|nr:helix-turn-helix transcriptional regulator [Bacteroidota bacterium]